MLALAVLAIGVGLGNSLVAEQLRRSRTAATLASAERIVLAVGAYVAANKRFPCAAAAAQPGIAQTGTACTSTPRGTVPWSDLGLQRRDAEDGYGRLLAYHVDPAFTSLATTTIAQLCSTSASTGSGTASDKPLKAYVTVAGSLASPTFGQQLLAGLAIPFTLLSAGANGHGAMTFDTTTLTIRSSAAPPDSQLAEAINAASTAAGSNFGSYIDRDARPALPDSDGYDDMVFYRSLSTFIALYAGGLC